MHKDLLLTEFIVKGIARNEYFTLNLAKKNKRICLHCKP